jgi:myo-inositol 2-dehydrogenase/D-chiro-inositol 1-dehydrogenase
MTGRIGVIGCGGMGMLHAGALARLGRPLVFCDADVARAERAARDHDGDAVASVEEAVATSIDGAVVATPTPAHAAVVATLVQCGVPTFCEKPLAMTLEDTGRLGALAETLGVLLQVGFHRRFDAGYRRVRHAVEEGALGRVVLVRAGTHEAAERAVPVAMSGTVLRDLVIHDFDALRYVSGVEAVAVTAYGVAGRAGVGDGLDWPAVAAIVELNDGSLGVVTGGRPNPPGYDARLEVQGSAGSAAAGLDERTPSHRRTDGDPPPYGGFLDRFGPAYDAEIGAFVRAVPDGGPNQCSWRDAYEALRLAIAAEKSLVDGRRVVLAEAGPPGEVWTSIGGAAPSGTETHD